MSDYLASNLFSSVQQQEQMRALSPTTKELLQRVFVEIAKDLNTNDLRDVRFELSKFDWGISQPAEWDRILKKCLRERIIVLFHDEQEKEVQHYVMINPYNLSQREREQSVQERLNARSASSSALQEVRQLLGHNNEKRQIWLDHQIKQKQRELAKKMEKLSQLDQLIHKRLQYVDELTKSKNFVTQSQLNQKNTYYNDQKCYEEEVQKLCQRKLTEAKRYAAQIIESAMKQQAKVKLIADWVKKNVDQVIENEKRQDAYIKKEAAKAEAAHIIENAKMEEAMIHSKAKQIIADAKEEERRILQRVRGTW